MYPSIHFTSIHYLGENVELIRGTPCLFNIERALLFYKIFMQSDLLSCDEILTQAGMLQSID